MPRFPRTKESILILGAKIDLGITNHAAEYPNPPFDNAPLQALLASSITLTADRVSKEAEYRAALEAENDVVLGLLPEEMRRLLNQAETTHAKNGPVLQMIGWDVPADPQSLAPGEVRNADVIVQGPGSAKIDWKPPLSTASTGKVATYLIERRVMDLQTKALIEDWGVWKEIAFVSEVTVTNQPRGVEITYRIKAANVNGMSDGVTTEEVVL